MSTTSSSPSTAKIICKNVWKVFGPQPTAVVQSIRSANENDNGAVAGQADQMQDGHVIAVRNVSFQVNVGETFVVMGLSGSGKSTLLRCLPRLIMPTEGTISVDGDDVISMNDHQLRTLRRHKMSMVFQHFGLFPHRTILDNVAYGLEIQGVKKAERHARAHTVLEQVNLKGWDQHYPGELSGGMQQRVGLARALAVDPEILLFDEPFSALDPLIRREMQDELLSLQQQMHKTIVFITHDFAEAIKLATVTPSSDTGATGEPKDSGRIAIMKAGQFVQVGTASEIILHPADQYVADFTQDVPRTSVLTAQSIMLPPRADLSGGQTIDANLKLDSLVTLFADTDATLAVTDRRGNAIGALDRRTVLRAISQNGALR